MSELKFYCRAVDLAIGYGITPLMEHIGLGVGKGTILTLIGPIGAGISTLLKTLAAHWNAEYTHNFLFIFSRFG